MLQHFDESRSHLVIPLLGKFKGEDHSSQHLMPCVHVTDSGIQVKTWMLRVMAVHQKLGRREGPMFIDSRGSQATTKDMNKLLMECLSEILERKPKLFSTDVTNYEELCDKL